MFSSCSFLMFNFSLIHCLFWMVILLGPRLDEVLGASHPAQTETWWQKFGDGVQAEDEASQKGFGTSNESTNKDMWNSCG
jgi:hypothetical protein